MSTHRVHWTAAAILVVLSLIVLRIGNVFAVGAQPSTTIELAVGCNNLVLTSSAGTPTVEVAAAIEPSAALQAIWRFENATQRFHGFSPASPAASDLTAVSRLDPVFICMHAPGKLRQPALGTSPPPMSHGGPVRDYVSLIDNLRALGAIVMPAGPVSQPFFSVPGQTIRVDGGQVHVFEYPTEAAAAAEARTISPDGGTVGRTSIMWIAPPHFYAVGRMIVLYVGTDSAIVRLLEAALGAQIAGR